MASLLEPLSPHSFTRETLSQAQEAYTIDDHVRIVDLVSDSGCKHNGKNARIMKPLNDRGRHEIFVSDGGITLHVKPINLRKTIAPVPCDKDANAALEQRIAKMILLAEEGGHNRELLLYMGLLRNTHDGKGYSKLATYLARIVACIRSWYGVVLDPSQVFIRGHPDGSTEVLIGTKKSDGKTVSEKKAFLVDQQRRLARVSMGILLLGALMHFRTVRRKVHGSDVIEILSSIIQAPIFDPYALETEMQCASSLLNNPGDDDDKRHQLVIARFFDPDPHTSYRRLRAIYEAVHQDTFSYECCRRLLRWSVAHMTGAERVLEMIGILRETIAQVEATDQGYAAMYCNADDCLKQELSHSRFSKCAKCMLARYCSKECQRRDWKRGHKQICCRASQVTACDEVGM